MEKTALYYIITGNEYGQILIFESHEAARRWSEAATRWTPEEIENNIKIAINTGRGYYNAFSA